jgi:SIR2-like domain
LSHHYPEFVYHFERLRRAHCSGQLVIVLGAGVGRPYGHPEWSDLITSLLLESGRVPRLSRETLDIRTASPAYREKAARAERAAIAKIFQRLVPDTLLQGNVARTAYPSDRWNDAIRKQLGPGTVPRPDTTREGVLRTVATMLADCIHENPRLHLSVLSFNYDTLLDDAVQEELEARNLDPSFLQSITKEDDYERTWADAGIYIYHLHGNVADKSSDPILDADSYVTVLRGDHWSWRCMDRVLMATGAAALFIGLSLADPSLRYVLTRWKSWQSPVTGVYLAPPPRLPDIEWEDGRAVAMMYRSIMDLYSAVLGRLHLACYHLSSWREIRTILKAVGGTA